MKTIGIHPKVKNPVIVGLLVGAALIVAGLIAKDSDIRTAGISVVLAALGLSGGVGYLSGAAPVTQNVGPANDDLLAHQDRVQP